jgi:DNA polymerase
VVVGRGNPNARLLLVGEAPGAEEEACGQPFVGRSGRLLEAMLAAAGLDSKRDLYIANVIKCRPPGNRKPSRTEIEACRPWLERQIALVRPQLVLLVGATALEALLGIKGGITQLRGQWLHLEASQGPDQPAPSQAAQRQRQRTPSPRSPIRWLGLGSNRGLCGGSRALNSMGWTVGQCGAADRIRRSFLTPFSEDHHAIDSQSAFF